MTYLLPNTGKSRVPANLPGAAAILFMLLATPAWGLEGLRPKLSELSKDIRDFLRGENTTNVTIGAVNGQKCFHPSAGPGIKKILGEELEKLGVQVKGAATFEVTMDYRVTVDKDRSAVEGVDIPQILLSPTFINTRTGDRCLLAASVRDQIDMPSEDLAALICHMFGINRPDQGAGQTIKQFAVWFKRMREEFVSSEDDPRVPTRRPFQQEGPYEVQILVKDDSRYAKRPLEERGKAAFVELSRGDQYAIELVNDRDHDVAVTLTIDGLNVFEFSDHNYRYFIVPKRSTLLVKGWHRNNTWSDAFLITEYSKSKAAERLSNPDEIGTITASFAAAWAADEDKPADEKGRAKSPGGIATGGGPKTPSKFKEVRRHVGRTRATVNVRYVKPMITAPAPI